MGGDTLEHAHCTGWSIQSASYTPGGSTSRCRMSARAVAGLYYGVTIVIVSLATAMTVLTLNIHHKGEHGVPVPRVVQRVCFDRLLARLLCLRVYHAADLQQQQQQQKQPALPPRLPRRRPPAAAAAACSASASTTPPTSSSSSAPERRFEITKTLIAV